MNFLISMLAGLTQPGEGAEQSKSVVDTVTQAVQAGSEAVTQAASGAEQSGFGMWGMILYIAFFVAIFYLLIIRPQKKKDKQLKEMQNSVKIGDEIMTSSGFFGKVVELTDDIATVEFGTNKGVRIPVKKTEIYGTKSNDSAEKTETK
jgi:preprotein translocase, yajC subunit